MSVGRYAPSPTGPLHLGNLRTALFAWLFARSARSRFVLRIDDLDPGRSRQHWVERQIADLAQIGIDWDGPVLRQSQRGDAYAAALAGLEARSLLYPCFCTRAEIRQAASAPHPGALTAAGGDPYPGTCRQLDTSARAARRAAGRPAALRVHAASDPVRFDDLLLGPGGGPVDDFVVARSDGVAAYNLAVVVDDAAARVEQVVRGGDLFETTGRQIWLYRALDLPVPDYAHLPLLLGPDGTRLAKRSGAATLADRAALGEDAGTVRARLAASLGLGRATDRFSPQQLVARFDPTALRTASR